MGNSASKQRQLGLQISKGASETINRTKNLKLPPQELRQRFEDKRHETLGAGSKSSSNEHVGSSTNQTSSPSSQLGSSTIKFDSSILKRRLGNKNQNENQVELPEGKDGFDPQVEGKSNYDTDFVKSINDLGRQINSFEVKQNFDKNVLPLRQLNQRKSLFEAGEIEKNDSSHHKSTIHPQTLSSILNDIHDPRMTNDKIIKNYNLDKNFINKLNRFRVAKTVVIMDEKTRGDEIGHKSAGGRTLDSDSPDHLDDAHVGEESHTDRSKLKNLKKRISLD